MGGKHTNNRLRISTLRLENSRLTDKDKTKTANSEIDGNSSDENSKNCS